jgi:hypothetical protein
MTLLRTPAPKCWQARAQPIQHSQTEQVVTEYRRRGAGVSAFIRISRPQASFAHWPSAGRSRTLGDKHLSDMRLETVVPPRALGRLDRTAGALLGRDLFQLAEMALALLSFILPIPYGAKNLSHPLARSTKADGWRHEKHLPAVDKGLISRRLDLHKELVHEPIYCSHEKRSQYRPSRSDHSAAITLYLHRCAAYAHSAFARNSTVVDAKASGLAEAIIGILLRHEFNHQSRGRVAHLLPAVHRAIVAQVAGREPIQFFMSYNGGYRATNRPDFSRPLGFDAAATELLLLFMIARLKDRLRSVYPPGMVCHVVLNNGVAHYVNDIPIRHTEDYARQLEEMVVALGGQNDVRVLLQSRLGDFAARMSSVGVYPAETIDAVSHHNIERFLGRPCTAAEARMRLGRYAPAETEWSTELREIVAAANGIRFLQVASPHFLSFRPFPGGATRAQTGQIGFKINSGKVVPVLVTTNTFWQADVLATPVCWPSVLTSGAPMDRGLA